MSFPCPVCGCMRGASAHAIAGALADDDVDRAIGAGLLSVVPCDGCNDACNARVIAARDARRAALAARERYRARLARLARRAEERAAARAAPVTATEAKPALPSAAAAALARAKARATERRKP